MILGLGDAERTGVGPWTPTPTLGRVKPPPIRPDAIQNWIGGDAVVTDVVRRVALEGGATAPVVERVEIAYRTDGRYCRATWSPSARRVGRWPRSTAWTWSIRCFLN
jgi:hypothetical protein